MLHPRKDLGAHVLSKAGGTTANAGAPSVITAAGALDNLKVTGQTINNINGGASGVLVLAGLTALGAAETLTAAVELQESSDGSSWDTAEVVEAATTVASGGAGGNFHFLREYDIELAKRKQYIRFNVTLNLSAGAADTALAAWPFVIGGDDVLPAA
jgi:hypothetical protein